MADTNTQTQKELIQGPDKKWYKVRKTDLGKFDESFKSKGWVKTDGKWSKAPPVSTFNPGPDPLKMKQSMEAPIKGVGDYASAALPTVGGATGSIVGGVLGAPTAGAGIGGGAGSVLRDLYQRSVMSANIPDKKMYLDALIEGGKQAALEKGGQKVGELFFNIVNKIPHAIVKQGIKFLPSEINPGGKISRYVEDLLSNLAPSAKTMDAFKTEQNAQIIKKVDTLVKGMSRMDLNSEQVGTLLRQTMSDGEDSALKSLKALAKSNLPAGKRDMGNLAKLFPKEVNDFMTNYRNELAKRIIGTQKPELIAGWLRQQNTGLEHTRLLTDKIHELKPDVLGKVQRRLVSDFLQESLTGSKDPVTKGMQSLTNRFAGDKWSKVLNTMGEEKLKAIFGDTGYKNLQKFTELTGQLGVNRQGSSVGRFLNLMFLLPFRSGIKIDALTKTGGTAFLLNRAAKVITSPEGMGIYETYIKAVAQNSPRLANLAIDELRKYNERSDAEFKQEQREAEQLYEQMKEKEKENK